jgi:hypothetical protein
MEAQVQDERYTEDLESLAQTVSAVVVGRNGRLVALTVAVPPDVDASDFERQFGSNLADVGLDFVDVRLQVRPGPMRLVSAEFER